MHSLTSGSGGLRLGISMLSAWALIGCGGTDAGPRLAVDVAALSLPGVGDAVWDVEVVNGQSQVVWQKRLSSSGFGDSHGAAGYVGPCDASAPAHTVKLWLVGVYGAPVTATGAFASGAPIGVSGNALEVVNPTAGGPLTRNATCVANSDSRVSFDVTVMRRAEQGFFDLAVTFEDVFCSAKFDCCYDDDGDGCEPGEDITLLFDEQQQRGKTFVLGFACVTPASLNAQPELYFDALELDCDVGSDATTFVADMTIDPSGAGNLCAAGDIDACSAVRSGDGVDADDYLYQAAAYQNYELTGDAPPWELVSWNVALGVKAPIAGCRLRARGTFDDAANETDHAGGGRIDANAVYPYVQWDVDLGSCGSEALTFGTGGPVSTEYARAGLAFGYHFGDGIAAGPFCDPACRHGGACVADACDCTGTGFSGPTCADPICEPSEVFEDGECIVPDTSAPAAPTFDLVSPYSSGDDTLTLTGDCEAGALILLDGAVAATCDGTFELTLTGADGEHSYDVAQRDAAGNVSPTATFVWLRDTTTPSVPVVLVPDQPYYSAETDLTLSGTCTTGSIVQSDNNTSECVGGTFALSENRTNDGAHVITLFAVNPNNGFVSASTTSTWNRDTTAPSAPTVSPASPHVSATPTLTISGACEDFAQVVLSGAQDDALACVGNAYSFLLDPGADGMFAYDVSQRDRAGNTSVATHFEWMRDTAGPDTPTLTTPADVTSNSASLVVAGTCEAGTAIELFGDASDDVVCDGTFTFEVPASDDGAYTFTLRARDAADNVSGTVDVTWLRDTLAPSAVTLTAPSPNPYTSGDDTLRIDGFCEIGATVLLSGDASDTFVCDGGFEFDIPTSENGTYHFAVAQRDPAGNTSAPVAVTWTRDDAVPDALTLTSPEPNPHVSNGDGITIAGACTSGNTVALSGDASGSATCASGAFAFPVTKTDDATYTFAVRQIGANNGFSSPTTTVIWTRDTVAPADPVVTAPAGGSATTNGNILSISGTCVAGTTIELGAPEPQSQPCNGTFVFVVAESSDGTYDYTVLARDAANNTSGSVAVHWTRDTAPPAPVALTAPTPNPFASGTDSLAIAGTCEPGTTVLLTIDDTQSTPCTGTFAFDVTKTSNSTYHFEVAQRDAAQNTSGSTTVLWTRDDVVPGPVTVTSPSPNPYISNGNGISIAGTCTSGNTVALSGDASGSTVCTSGAFAFPVTSASDGTFVYSLRQVGKNNGFQSSAVTVTWTRDSATPGAVTLTAPSPNPFASGGNTLTIAGICENAATVLLSGDDAQSTTCTGTFSFNVTKTSNAVYHFDVAQRDAALNTSPTVAVTWSRDDVVPPEPTLTSPTPNPHISNGNGITIAGTCVSGNTVTLSGDTTGSTTCAAGAFSFPVTSNTDGTTNYSVRQIGALNGFQSAATTVQWTRDTVAPDPVAPTYPSRSVETNGDTLTMFGTCTAGTTVELSGASTQSQACNGSYSFNVGAASDGPRTYTLIARDLASNASTAKTFTWTRDTAAPAPVGLTAPSPNPVSSGTNTLAIAGTCESGATVLLAGDDTQSTTCNGTFSFNVSKTSNATYAFQVAQRDAATNTSTNVTVTWTRDDVVANPVVVTNPAVSPAITNTNTLTIAGTCTSGNNVSMIGSAADSMTCSGGGTFSFLVGSSSDGTTSYFIRQAKPSNGFQSADVQVDWTRDTVPPGPVTLTAPSPNPYNSGENSLTIAGTCTSGNSIVLAGDSSDLIACDGGAFTLNVTKSANATFHLTVAQRDAATNTSSTVAVTWNRDATVPSAPTLTSPSPNPITSNGNGITIAGGCTSGNTINLAGAASASTTCASNSYSFPISSLVDGTFVYTLTQVGAINGFVSSTATVTWTRDTITPASPTVTQPSTNPYASGDTSFMLVGGCEPNATVLMTGSATGSTTCAGDSSYMFSLGSSVDGTFNYSIRQRDAAQNTSSATAFQWLRDNSIPASPALTNPVSSPFDSSASSLSIQGTCTNTYLVFLQGASTQSTTCSGGAFAFTDNKSVDNSYSYSLYQQNPNNGAQSTVITLVWNRDTTRPDEVSVTSPPSNPYFSGDDTITITGGCEVGTTVSMSGSSSGSAQCTAGTYAFPVTKTSNATYNFNLVETDRAGNVSLNYLFQWVRDNTVPATPVVTSPATSPFYSSGSSLVISGTCTTGLRVDLTGSSTQNMTCAANAFSFTVPGATDLTRNYSLEQTNTNTNIASADIAVQWVRDATAPAVVVITQPATNPYSSGDTLFALNGTCETNATVALAGAQTGSVTCTAGAFHFDISKSSNGTYNYTLRQTDRANNPSAFVNFQWIRDTSIPPTPVLSSPNPNPFISNGNNITVAGSCVTGNTVNLSGAQTSSMTCASGAFSFSVTKSSDSTYNFSVVQVSSINGSSSSAVPVQWTRDTVAPSAPTITSVSPQSPAATLNPKVIGSATGATTMQVFKSASCGGTATTGPAATFTSSGIAMAATAQSAQSFTAKSVDAAGNASTCSNSVSWTHRSAQLVKDINTTGSGDSSPNLFGIVGTKAFFRAQNGILGNELWVTDGTVAGTYQVKDINVADSSNPSGFTEFGGLAYFAADDGEYGSELWKSDGTENGTVRVADINDGAAGSSPANFLKVSSTVMYFTADDGDNGVELWKTDGTDAGTVLVKDCEPGASSSSPGNLRAVGTAPTIVFTATTSNEGLELWKSNGTTAGTTNFDIYTGITSSSPQYLVNFNNYVYMYAANATLGGELFRTDGSTVSNVVDLYPGTTSGAPTYLAVAGSKLFFSARQNTTVSYELFTIDTAGTVTMVKDINATTNNTNFVANIAALSSTKVVFRTSDGTSGIEPYVSDGTSAGTFRLADINSGALDSAPSLPVVVNGKAYFSALSDAEQELYETDGTVAGTVKKNLNPGTQSSSPSVLTAYGTKLLLSAYTAANGREPWIVDTGGPHLLEDLNTQTSSSPSTMAQVGTSAVMLFSADDGVNGRELWKTDGTLAGTSMLKDINTTSTAASSNPNVFVSVGNFVFFRADDGVNGTELWRSDGTAAGTVQYANICPSSDPSNPASITALNTTTVLFSATDCTNGIELWKATTSSTTATLVSDINSGAGLSSSPTGLVLMGTKIYMRATRAAEGAELWSSDGTTATLVANVRAGSSSSSPGGLTVVNGNRLYFSATNGVATGQFGTELYLYDGTTTALVGDINPGVANSSPANLRDMGNGTLIFAATTVANGRELYATTGGTGLTVGSAALYLVKDIRAGAGSSSPGNATLVGTKAYFAATDDAAGTELWETDGTAVNTVKTMDIRPGTAGSSPSNIWALDTSNFWFTANEGVNGTEPWRSNKTAATTYLVQDINTLGPSWGGAALVVNGVVYFSATDGNGGLELWKY